MKYKKPKRVQEILQERHSSSTNDQHLTPHLETNLATLREHLNNCADVKFRPLSLHGRAASLIYTEGMIDKYLLSEGVLQSLFAEADLFSGLQPLEEKIKETLPIDNVNLVTSFEELYLHILSGFAVILFEQIPEAITIGLQGYEKRGIETPEVEPTIAGPKESFTETLTTNISLIRKRVLHPDCKVQLLTLGKYSQIKVAVLYIESIAHEKLVAEVFRRLEGLNLDIVLEANSITELITDSPASIFPTMQLTERPDKVVASLLEGRIAILQENSPTALMAPALLSHFIQAADDYYRSFWFGSFIRYLRMAGAFISLYLPALYTAMVTFNAELIPTKLLISLSMQREAVPFATPVEVVFMGLAFEVLREAGTRLPRVIGQAVSIVGALIIGEAATNAGLVSPALVIITAITAISSFTIPSIQLADSFLVLRFIIFAASSVLGFWGIFVISLLILGHLAALRSFGIPYLTPFSPLTLIDLEDVLARAPLWELKRRPSYLSRKNLRRLGTKKPNSGQ